LLIDGLSGKRLFSKLSRLLEFLASVNLVDNFYFIQRYLKKSSLLVFFGRPGTKKAPALSGFLDFMNFLLS